MLANCSNNPEGENCFPDIGAFLLTNYSRYIGWHDFESREGLS